MATDFIRYDLLVQDALRSVVRKVLADTARNGLAGEHHFNIAFKTHAAGRRRAARRSSSASPTRCRSSSSTSSGTSSSERTHSRSA